MAEVCQDLIDVESLHQSAQSPGVCVCVQFGRRWGEGVINRTHYHRYPFKPPEPASSLVELGFAVLRHQNASLATIQPVSGAVCRKMHPETRVFVCPLDTVANVLRLRVARPRHGAFFCDTNFYYCKKGFCGREKGLGGKHHFAELITIISRKYAVGYAPATTPQRTSSPGG